MASDPPVSLPMEQPQQKTPTSTHIFAWHTFKHHLPRFVATIVVDIVLPLVIYFALQKYVNPVYALLAAGAPPLVMVIYKAVLHRSFDIIAFLVFFAFIIAGVVAVITKNPIVLLLEKSLVTAVLSLIFGITLIPFQCCHANCNLRPLVYYFYEDLLPTTREEIGLPDSLFNDRQQTKHEDKGLLTKLTGKQEVDQVYNWIYTHCPSFRTSCYVMTAICSIGFLLEFLARLSLILMGLSVTQIIVYGDIILTLITIICIGLAVISIIQERRQTLIAIEQWKKENLNIES
jgi:hypothetical protein